jgi:hypothetical protein
MSADWYYVRHGWFYKGKKIGPIGDHDFLLSIDKGSIEPNTLVQSETKTKGRWVRMKSVKLALARYHQTHVPKP